MQYKHTLYRSGGIVARIAILACCVCSLPGCGPGEMNQNDGGAVLGEVEVKRDAFPWEAMLDEVRTAETEQDKLAILRQWFEVRTARTTSSLSAITFELAGGSHFGSRLIEAFPDIIHHVPWSLNDLRRLGIKLNSHRPVRYSATGRLPDGTRVVMTEATEHTNAEWAQRLLPAVMGHEFPDADAFLKWFDDKQKQLLDALRMTDDPHRRVDLVSRWSHEMLPHHGEPLSLVMMEVAKGSYFASRIVDLAPDVLAHLPWRPDELEMLGQGLDRNQEEVRYGISHGMDGNHEHVTFMKAGFTRHEWSQRILPKVTGHEFATRNEFTEWIAANRDHLHWDKTEGRFVVSREKND